MFVSFFENLVLYVFQHASAVAQLTLCSRLFDIFVPRVSFCLHFADPEDPYKLTGEMRTLGLTMCRGVNFVFSSFLCCECACLMIDGGEGQGWCQSRFSCQRRYDRIFVIANGHVALVHSDTTTKFDSRDSCSFVPFLIMIMNMRVL